MTFTLQKPNQVSLIGKAYFPEACWPPSRPVPGSTAVVIGFPGAHRQVGGSSLGVNLTVLCDKVSSVSDRHFVLADEERTRISVKMNPTLGELKKLGGMSGSRVFTVHADGDASFAGLLYEADEGKEATVFAVHADFVTAEGKIDHSKASW